MTSYTQTVGITVAIIGLLFVIKDHDHGIHFVLGACLNCSESFYQAEGPYYADNLECISF